MFFLPVRKSMVPTTNSPSDLSDTMNTVTAPTMRHFCFLALFLTFFSLSASAQIGVAPTRVMMTNPERSKEITLSNPNTTPMVVEAKIVYALMKSDSNGAMAYDSVGLGSTGRPSCAEWAKVFPKRFTLQPNESRSLRVLLSPPSGVADGEYLARLIVISEPVARPAPLVVDTTKVVTEIRTRIHTGLPVIFRKGSLSTGIQFDLVRPSIVPDGIRLLADLYPEGNATYRGTLFAEIFGSDGASVAKADMQVGAEMAVLQPFVIPSLNPGVYTLRVDAKPVRMGSAAETVIPAALVTHFYRLTVASDQVSIAPITSN